MKYFLSLLVLFCLFSCQEKKGKDKGPMHSMAKDSKDIPHITPSNNDSIPKNYYTYFGERDWWRFPLVYPYSIHTVEDIGFGTLYDESAVHDLKTPGEALIETDIYYITHLTFDKNYLLAKIVTEQWTNEGKEEYVIFNFKTKEKFLFDDVQSMSKKAKLLHFQGNAHMSSLKTYAENFLNL